MIMRLAHRDILRTFITILTLLILPCLSIEAQEKIYSTLPPEEETEIFEEDREIIDDADFESDDYDNSHELPKAELDSTDVARLQNNWWQLLKRGKLNPSDTTVVYPKFLDFCMKVYRWADKAFNSYDTDYVVGTGKRWKVRLLSDNWSDSYSLTVRDKYSIRMMSDIYCNFGVYLQYMAVSVGYSLDLSNIIGNRPANHKKLGFSFTCARFTADLHYEENTGGTVIRHFTLYDPKKLLHLDFPGLTLHTYGLDAYYFFNNKRYSQGAAYAVSRIQKRSQGSGIIGFSYNHINIGMDFAKLPQEICNELEEEDIHVYRYHYNSYSLLGGYGHNFVVGKHTLFNITALPKVGIAKCYDDSLEADKTLVTFGILGKGSATFNFGNYFINVAASINGSWYSSRSNSFFSSINNVALSAGVRF